MDGAGLLEAGVGCGDEASASSDAGLFIFSSLLISLVSSLDMRTPITTPGNYRVLEISSRFTQPTTSHRNRTLASSVLLAFGLFAGDVGFWKSREDSSRLDLEKELLICFDFRRSRSRPPGPTITCRLTG
jgi:hypothetical protein